jgi:hydrogenase maturation factor
VTHCVTCSDEGAPMRVVRVNDQGLALCEDACGRRHTVEIALVDAQAGDEVLVHAGVALVTL